jgi:hypothetical protein
MEIQNSTSALGKYWDVIFTDLAGLCDLKKAVIESVKKKKIFCIFIRSPDKPLALNQFTRARTVDHRTLPLLCQLMGTEIHERSQTIPIQKHFDCVQFYSSAN